MSPLRILLASSEVHPYSKTGGLADMAGALARSLAQEGQRVGVVTPLYRGIREKHPEMGRTEWRLDLPLGYRRVVADVWALVVNAWLTVYFLDQPDFYQREGIYGEHGVDYADNAERFIFFSKCVAHLARILPWHPQILHAHDWQAALAPLFTWHQRHREDWLLAPRTCQTIHNLAYQGIFSASAFALTNLPWDYFTPEGVEFYGRFNCLKAGLAYADVLTTVSPRYAREITTPEYGCGLDGLLRHRQASLVGILNGADYEEWNTTHNRCLTARYSARDLSGKARQKRALQSELGLRLEAGTPLFGNVTRLVEQKGVDLLLGALEEMLPTGLQFAMLGTGDPHYERAFLDLARWHPGQVAVRIGYDQCLAHRIEAGADFYLMPSRYEPCGLNQMYSQRYGTIPIVRATGGLDDTVVDMTEDQNRANGIKFWDYSVPALAKAIRKALVLYQTPELLRYYQQNAMKAEFSWRQAAAKYLEVFEKLLEQAPGEVVRLQEP